MDPPNATQSEPEALQVRRHRPSPSLNLLLVQMFEYRDRDCRSPSQSRWPGSENDRQSRSRYDTDRRVQVILSLDNGLSESLGRLDLPVARLIVVCRPSPRLTLFDD